MSPPLPECDQGLTPEWLGLWSRFFVVSPHCRDGSGGSRSHGFDWARRLVVCDADDDCPDAPPDESEFACVSGFCQRGNLNDPLMAIDVRELCIGDEPRSPDYVPPAWLQPFLDEHCATPAEPHGQPACTTVPDACPDPR